MKPGDTRRAFRSDAMRGLFDHALRAGWTYEHRGSGHLRLRSPKGDCVIVSTTAVNNRDVWNTRSILRRKGLDV